MVGLQHGLRVSLNGHEVEALEECLNLAKLVMEKYQELLL